VTESTYLSHLADRAAAVLHNALVGVYAGGSWALGDYRPGRSDLDVAIVCASPLDDGTIDELAARLRHESLPCPARGLELVVYTRAVAGAGKPEAGFELNLNTGERMDPREERHGGTVEAHWYAIDRAILAQNGVALSGPPAPDVFRAPPRPVLLGLLGLSLRWHAGGDAEPENAVLNAARSIVYAREGRWVSKPVAARRLIDAGESAGLVEAALAVRDGAPATLDPAGVRDFVRHAAKVVATGERGSA
jgi:hypothetical protein